VEVREREFSVIKAGKALTVEPKAFRVLLYLVRNPQKLVTKEQLLDAVWDDAAVAENSLTRAIAKLRRLLDDDFREPRYIATVATVGYRFVCNVEVVEEISENGEAIAETNGFPPNGFHGANGRVADPIAEAAAAVEGLSNEQTSADLARGARRRAVRLVLIFASAFVVAGLAAVVWYLYRPLPPTRIADFMQITHDGHEKAIVGTDGNRIYLNQRSPRAIEQVSARGGEIDRIPVSIPALVGMWSVSPDGSSFLLGANEERNAEQILWDVRALGGPARRLGEVSGSATYSPDGESIAYSTPDGNIILAQTSGTGQRKLVSLGRIPTALVWSPDGKSIAYLTDGKDIFVLQVEGSEARKLPSPGGSLSDIVWSPDGKRLRFTRDSVFWEISSDGTGLHPLFPDWKASWSQCCGSWTADGNFFIFLSGEPWTQKGSELFARDERHNWLRQVPTMPVQLTSGPVRWDPPIAGKDAKKFFAPAETDRGELARWDAQSHVFEPFLGGISGEGVTFSRDGREIAYVSYPEGDLWKANADGSNRQQLTGQNLNVYLPRWSSDGTQILYVASPGDHTELFVISSQGGAPQRLFPADNIPRDDADWSSDGKQIVFDSPGGWNPKSAVYLLDIPSKKVTTVPGSVGLFSPRWSPDGRFIAANSSLDSRSLSIFDVQKKQWSKVFDKFEISFPEWSRDNQFIYFWHGNDDEHGLYRVRVAGGKPERIANLKDVHLTGWMNMWIGLDPSNNPLILRDAGTLDVWALTLDEK